MKNLLLLLAFFGAAFFTPVFGQLDVKPGDQPPFTPENLITNFMTSGGINVLNVTYNGSPEAVGYFSGGDTIIGLERGIILTTGSASGEPNANYGADGIGDNFASYGNSGPGTEPHLSAISTGTLFDVAYYTITFQSYNDSIRFRYVFASEEYPEYACTQFNDIFGFFLEGPGYASPVNIALIPGTSLPVSINNVHPSNPAASPCNPYNAQFYNNNNGSSKQPVYDGVLDPFVATAAVEPCGIYTMTIAISDVGDGIFDTGVFLEANSFGSTPYVESSFGPGSNVLPEGATGLPVSLNFSQIPAGELPLTVTFGGDAVRGTDYTASDSTFTINTTDSVLMFSIQPLEDTLQEIVETVVVNVAGSNCFIKTFELFIADPGIIFKGPDTVLLSSSPVLGGDITSGENTISTFSNDTDIAIDPVNTTVSSGIIVSGVALEKLTDPAVIESVCLNIDHNWVGDLNVYLVAPGGKYMELTTDNGGSGDNYTGTCFSPAATQPVDFGLGFAPIGAAPFTGLFQPEGKWTDLTGSDVNGEWKLMVSDNTNGIAGMLKDWSITFNTALAGNFKYQWSTGESTKTIQAAAPGFYTVTVSNPVAAFSKKYLVQAPCGFSQQSYTLCHGESVVVNGVTYNESNNSGRQVFSLSPGCDSILYVQVNVLPALNQVINATVCDGATYTFGNEVISTNGTYQQSLTSMAGCDSLVTLHLNVAPKYTTDLQAVICSGEAYEFGTELLTGAGTYQHILQTVNGCDSTVRLELQVLTVATSTTEASICSGETYLFGNQALTLAGTYQQSFTAVNGCDSLATLHLSLHPQYVTNLDASICNGDSYPFGNQNITETGIYTNQLQTINGCDSVIILNLQVHPTAVSETTASICEGETYAFNGLLLPEAGDYTATLVSGAGCDSISILHLSVLPASTDSIFVVLQLGEVFEAGGMQFNEFGDFIVNLVAANGCDSTLFLHIEIVDGVSNADISQRITISPNPAHGAVQIQWPADMSFEQITVRSADQRTVLTQSATTHSGNTVIDVSAWQSGLYLIELNGPSGNAIRKLIRL